MSSSSWGSEIEAGVLVAPRGRAKALMLGGALSELGSALKVGAEVAAEQAGGGRSPLGTLSGKLGYLAVTETEVLLLDGRQGLTTPKATGVAARVPRQSIASVALGGGTLAMAFEIAFEDGVRWELEIGRANTKQARAVLERLQPA